MSYIPHRVMVAFEEHSQLLDMIEQQVPVNEIKQMAHEHRLCTSEAYQKSPRFQSSPARTA